MLLHMCQQVTEALTYWPPYHDTHMRTHSWCELQTQGRHMALKGSLKIVRYMPPVIDVNKVPRIKYKYNTKSGWTFFSLPVYRLQVLQKLGKADETRDAAFEEMVANFNKQMVRGHFFKSFILVMKSSFLSNPQLKNYNFQICFIEMHEWNLSYVSPVLNMHSAVAFSVFFFVIMRFFINPG